MYTPLDAAISVTKFVVAWAGTSPTHKVERLRAQRRLVSLEADRNRWIREHASPDASKGSTDA